VGLTLHTTAAHIARSILDAICFQTRDVIEAMLKDTGGHGAGPGSDCTKHPSKILPTLVCWVKHHPCNVLSVFWHALSRGAGAVAATRGRRRDGERAADADAGGRAGGALTDRSKNTGALSPLSPPCSHEREREIRVSMWRMRRASALAPVPCPTDTELRGMIVAGPHVLGLVVSRPADVETTAMGAALAAGVGAGMWVRPAR
jgi:hypothetical protein